MSNYDELFDFIENNQKSDTADIIKPAVVPHHPIESNFNKQPFSIDYFAEELRNKSENKNAEYIKMSSYINSYDIAHNCIRQIVYKLNNQPVKSFANKWLPILLRSTLGTACHDFIQNNSDQFTETEISVKIPSIKFSGRIDNLIGNNILVEIKSTSYKDYQKIIKTAKPRIEDFYQTLTYKIMLEKYLNEAKDPNIPTRTNKPMLNNYDIDTFQYIYIAHDALTSDCEDLGQCLKNIETTKKMLNSKSNSFYFMTTLTLDLRNTDLTSYIKWIEQKINNINWYVINNKLPPHDDVYIKKSCCFFCIYNDVCDIKN